MHHRGAYVQALSNAIDFGGLPADGGTRYLWTLPMFHCACPCAKKIAATVWRERERYTARLRAGNGWGFPSTLAAVGGTNVCLRDVTVDGIAQAFAEQGVTHLCGAPIVVNLAIQAMERAAPGRRIRMMTAGAAPAAATAARGRRGFRCHARLRHDRDVRPGGGLRGAGVLARGRGAGQRRRARAPRTPRAGDWTSFPETGAPVPRDGRTMGEVVFGGNVVMKGYLKDEEATAAAFRLGALASGDLAVKDEDGYVAIRDRSKDLIISGGENVSSLSVEAALMEHDAVALCAVVARPDEKWGETPCAFVETTEDVDAEPRLRDGAAAQVRGAEDRGFGGELPRTSTGKIRSSSCASERASCPRSNRVCVCGWIKRVFHFFRLHTWLSVRVARRRHDYDCCDARILRSLR